jgi:hypothetical protein
MTEHQHTTSTSVEYRILARFEGYRFGDDGSIWTCLVRVYSSSGRTGEGGWKYVPGDEWRRLATTVDPNGYLSVSLRRRTYRVHSLILEAFVGPCPVGMECRHLDGTRTNNRLDNLQWATPKVNNADKRRHGTERLGERHPWAKLTWAKVAEARAMHAAGTSMGDLSRRFGVSITAIRHAVRRLTWTEPPI